MPHLAIGGIDANNVAHLVEAAPMASPSVPEFAARMTLLRNMSNVEALSRSMAAGCCRVRRSAEEASLDRQFTVNLTDSCQTDTFAIGSEARLLFFRQRGDAGRAGVTFTCFRDCRHQRSPGLRLRGVRA